MILALVALFALSSAVSALSVANCSRGFLADASTAYLAAQAAGKPSVFVDFFAPNATYSENDKHRDVRHGILTTPMRIDRSHSYFNTTRCGALVEVMATAPAAGNTSIAANSTAMMPFLIHTRFLFSEKNLGIRLVESVVTKPGDWAFNATGYLYYDAFESWGAIAPGQRDSRALVQAAGDAYFDRFANASVAIPVASACARLEGGSYTARGNFSTDTCKGYPSTIVVMDRRYIVDEEFGVVSIFIGFPQLDRALPHLAVPDSHIFRVEHGKIRYIHTASHCPTYNCGLNSTTFGRRSIR